MEAWLLFLILSCASLTAQPWTINDPAWMAQQTSQSSSTPDFRTNLKLELEADAGAYTDAGTTPATNPGDAVQQWNDQSGNGYNFTQLRSTGYCPLYYPNEQGGLPGLLIVSPRWITNKFMSFASGSWTMFLVVSNYQTGTSSYFSDVQSGRLICISSKTTTNGVGWFDGSYHTANYSLSGPHILCWDLSAGATSDMYVDNVAVGISATYTSTAIGGAVSLGAGYDGSSSLSRTFLYHVRLYSGALSSTDRTTVYNFLKAKWGL